jgi:hypothetical protein
MAIKNHIITTIVLPVNIELYFSVTLPVIFTLLFFTPLFFTLFADNDSH